MQSFSESDPLLMRVWRTIATALVLALPAVSARAVDLINGIDVSNHQGPSINWTQVKTAGYAFAFAKATEGVDFNDASFAANMTGAANAGVYIGPYHYGRIDSNIANPNDAVDEANDFVDRILQIAPTYGQTPGYYLRPVLDVEELPYADTAANRAANKAYTSEWVRDFAARVQTRLGMTPIIYSNTYYATTFFETNLNQHPFWMANYNYAPPTLPPASEDGIFNGWDFWQYSSTGPVSGVPTADVDKNVYLGTMDQLLDEFLVVQPNGDFNNDGNVDGRDFLTWQRNNGRTGATATFANGDSNGNRTINLADMTVWEDGFGGPGAVASGGVIPEPAAATLTLLAILAAARLRRHTGTRA